MFKNIYELKVTRGTESMLDRIRLIIKCYIGNDPEESISDGGVSMVFKSDPVEFIKIKKSLTRYAKTLPVGVGIDLDRF